MDARPHRPVTPLLRFEGVGKRFGAEVAVDAVDLEVREGEFFALLGPSGCGKTTLLRLVAGLERADAGRILLDGADIAPLPPHRRPVHLMFQSLAIFPHLTVGQNVAFGLASQGLGRTERAGRVAEMLALVGLEGFERRRPDQLSGGQRQRVALARALAPRPRVLLLDEPLSALDRRLREETGAELKALQRRLGTTFVMVTHDQVEAMALADRMAVMRAGRLEQAGAPRDLYARPASRFVAEFLGEANVLPDGRLLRPEAITLAEAAGAGVSGAVVEVAWLGDRVRYRVATAQGELKVVRPTGEAPARAGEQVGLAWAPDAVLEVKA